MTALSNSLAYDAENRVVTDTNSTTGTTTNYTYDGLGQRIAKSIVGGLSTVYVYDQLGNLAAEYATGTVPAPPCVTCYVSDDALGSTRMVTDQTGAVQATHDYYPFGAEVGGSTAGRSAAWGTADNLSQKFTGQERDSETGLDHFPARHFASAIGRFMVPDPAGNFLASVTNPEAWNMYSYAGNNPLAFVDPSGLACIYQGADNGDASDYADPTNYIDDDSGGQNCADAFASPPQQITVTDNYSLNELNSSGSGLSQSISQGQQGSQAFSFSGPEAAKQRADARARCVNGLIAQAALRGFASFVGATPPGGNPSAGDVAGLARDAARSPGAAVAVGYTVGNVVGALATKEVAATLAVRVGSEFIPFIGQAAAVVAVGSAVWDGVSWYRDQLNNGACGR